MSSVALLVDHPEITVPATFNAVIVNRGKQTLEYGPAYSIERWDGESWQNTDLAPKVFPLILFILGPDEIGNPSTVKIPGKVRSGFYRVSMAATEKGTSSPLELYALFHVRGAAA